MEKEFAQYLLNKTKDDYNLIAKDFSRTRDQIWQELSFLFLELKKKQRVLDLGCGNARFYPLLKEKGVDYTGIDFSDNLVRIAREKYPKAKFLVGSGLSLPFRNNYFDKIYSIAVLHQIPSKEFRFQFLKEAKKVLKPKGKLILIVWKPKKTSLLLKYTILKIIGKSKMDFKDVLIPWEDQEIKRYYHLFSKRALNKLVREAGFKIEKSGIIKNKTGNRQNIYLIAKK